jgi:hypothetical protein
MARLEIEMQGLCAYCNERTDWYAGDGWVFHVVAAHWRCQVCRCATQPHLFLSPVLVKKIAAEQFARHIADDDVIEIEVGA